MYKKTRYSPFNVEFTQKNAPFTIIVYSCNSCVQKVHDDDDSCHFHRHKGIVSLFTFQFPHTYYIWLVRTLFSYRTLFAHEFKPFAFILSSTQRPSKKKGFGMHGELKPEKKWQHTLLWVFIFQFFKYSQLYSLPFIVTHVFMSMVYFSCIATLEFILAYLPTL